MSNEIEYIYPASSLQQGFIYHALSQPDDDAYRLQVLYDYHQSIDTAKYVQAWEYCIAQYPILRTAFNWEEDIIQVIYQKGRLNYQLHDVSHLATQPEKDRAINVMQAEDRKIGFDLTTPTLLRVHIIKQAENYYTILKTEHHTITDGWSAPVLLNSLHQYYRSLIENRKVIVNEDTAYINTQEYITEHKSSIQQYWNTALADVDGANDINTLLSKPLDANQYRRVENPAENSYEITGDFYTRLKSFGQQEGITTNVMLQFVWHKLLQVYSGKTVSIVGTTVSGRELPIDGIEESVGMYVNTLPLVIDWGNNYSITEQLHQIQQKITALNTHSFADLAKIQKNGERLFHSLFVYENYPRLKEEKDDLKITTRNDIDKADYPLGILAFERDNSIVFTLQYDGNYLAEDKAEKHIQTLVNLLHQIIKNPEKPHHQLSLLQPEEYNQIVYEWNATDKAYPEDKTINALFEEQAAKTPGNIALVYQWQELSYRELNEKSNQLARQIREQYTQKTGQSLTPDSLIALCLDRGLEMIIGMLAILKAGGAYVPIDPEYPQERIDFMLEDTRATLILSQRRLTEGGDLQLPRDKIVHIDLAEEFYKEKDTDNLPANSGAKSLAYVIYTSGTTGKPKGVMVEHSGVNNEILSLLAEVPLNETDRSLLTANIIFDAAAECIYMSLFSGGALHIVGSGSILDADFIAQYLESSAITVINTTPAYLKALSIDQSATYLKYIILGGEQYQRVESSARIYNGYGPTEATIVSTLVEINNQDKIHIGKPINNTRVYVLGPGNNPVPICVIGELHIGGAGLSRGYLNRPDLTKERFVANPFATENDRAKGYTRLYKTGDLVRWLPDGNLEYIGRNDEQVKLHGYRIELGEIEHALTGIAGIKQACVLAKGRKTETGNTPYLAAYYVADKSDEMLSTEILQNKLSKVLPEYMVPGTFVEMESLPLTVNGKLDKRALPDPDFSDGDNYIRPRTEIEAALCKIWETVFGIENISVTDNFFRIGGDSILSIQVSSRTRQAGYPCQVKDIFEHKTISKLAAHLGKKSPETAVKTEQGKLTGELGFLPVQEWFISQVNNEELAKPGHWNQSFLIKVPELDIKKLESIIGDLVAYHDVFRIRYVKEEKSWKQIYQPDISLPEFKTLDISKYTGAEVQEILTGWQCGFDLELGPLFQLGYLHSYEDGSARIFIAMHHMIVDGVSWRILTEDIKALYSGIPLQQKGSSYRQWVTCVKNYASLHPMESAYWEEQLRGMPHYQPEEYHEPGECVFELNKELTTSLLQEASKAYHTEVNDLLLTALAYALKEINHADVQGITLEGHGREDIDPSIDHSRTVGWFTTMFPVKLELKSNLKESIQFIKESLRKIPNKGIGFGAFATEKESPYTQNDLPPIGFNYLGQFNNEAGDWQVVAEGSGKNVHPGNLERNLVSIDGMVSDGKLAFSVVTRLGSHTTKQLSDSFETQLTRIIKHCIETLESKGSNHTPSDFKSVKISQSLLDKLETAAKLNQNGITQIYPASSLQQGFIYHAISRPDDDVYRVQVLYDYHHSIDIAKYIQAWEYCIAQYPILRTAFNWEEDIIQVIYQKGRLRYQLHDISQLTTQQEKDQAVDAIQAEDRKTGFDLTMPTLLRLHIIKQAADYYTVLKTEHHSIADGWSGPVLLNSLHQHYRTLAENRKVIVNEDNAYVNAQEYIIAHKSSIQEYWNTALADVEGANDISPLFSAPIDLRNYRQVVRPATSTLEITGDSYNQLKIVSQKAGVTMNVIVQFLWHKLLQVYTGKNQTIAGTTISGRDLPIEGLEESVGMYVNTLPLVINWSNNYSITEQLQQIQQKIIELNTYGFADLAKTQRNGERIFHTLLVYENYPEPKESGALLRASLRNVVDGIDYPLGVIVLEQGEILAIRLFYDNDYLKEADAQRHLLTLNRIIDQIIHDPGKPHNQISLLGIEEHNKIIYQWNVTDKDYQKEKTIVQLFEDQVFKTPDNIALVYDGKQLSYRELNEKSNQLACYIRTQYREKAKQGLAADTLIALYLNRSLEMVVAILAVLKAGGAYVPLEINYPQDRLDFILGDSGVKLILTQKHLSEGIYRQLPHEMTIYVDLSEKLYLTEDVLNPPPICTAKDLAYVLYTSGTTGKPKGVMVEHLSVSNRILHMINYSNINSNDYYLFKTNYVFDVSVSDIFTHLCAGAKLYITKHVFDLDELEQLLLNIKFTSIHLVPSQYDLLSAIINNSSVSKLYFSGEAITAKIISGISKKINIYNYYGPTETGEITVSNPKTPRESPVIGKIFANSRQYVLGSNNIPVPIGVAGELLVGGASLARGYLNLPDLTKERFVANQFATEADKAMGYNRLYKTGDLVRWLPDGNGNLEYLGRNDEQVKIRGYRIELGEIEHALAQIDGIKQNCVLAKERETGSGNTKYLVGYYVVNESSETVTQAIIIKQLLQVLPEYMVPDIFVELASFPLTINGKLDKRALPDPDFGISREEFVAPATETETELCRIWQELLSVERVGMTDDFFRLGGNSILAIQVSHSMSRLLGYEVKVAEVFKYKNIYTIINSSFSEVANDSFSGREFEI